MELCVCMLRWIAPTRQAKKKINEFIPYSTRGVSQSQEIVSVRDQSQFTNSQEEGAAVDASTCHACSQTGGLPCLTALGAEALDNLLIMYSCTFTQNFIYFPKPEIVGFFFQPIQDFKNSGLTFSVILEYTDKSQHQRPYIYKQIDTHKHMHTYAHLCICTTSVPALEYLFSSFQLF